MAHGRERSDVEVFGKSSRSGVGAGKWTNAARLETEIFHYFIDGNLPKD